MFKSNQIIVVICRLFKCIQEETLYLAYSASENKTYDGYFDNANQNEVANITKIFDE